MKTEDHSQIWIISVAAPLAGRPCNASSLLRSAVPQHRLAQTGFTARGASAWSFRKVGSFLVVCQSKGTPIWTPKINILVMGILPPQNLQFSF